MGNFAIIVGKKEAEKVRVMLIENKLLDESRKIKRYDDWVEFPVKKKIKGYKLIEQKEILYRNIFPPFEEIKRRLKGRISKKDFEKLPKKWEKFGNVLVLKMEGIEEKEKIAKVYADVLKCKSVLEDVEGIRGMERKPIFKFIIGNDGETIHVENRIKYKFDVSKIMFSSGNIDERIRMSKIANEKDIFVDMFAGIGYFTLPVAVYGKAKVYAIEINPIAYSYLKENIKLNKVEDRVKPILGDCRKMVPNRIANHVIMGYLNSLPFLPYALKSINKEGIIHLHQKCKEKEFPYILFNEAKKIINGQGYEAEMIFYKKIKSYAPHIMHGVIDIKVKNDNKI